MLVLNGKKLRYGILGVFVMFLVVAITLTSRNEKTEFIDTVSLPVSGKVVVVDATSRNEKTEFIDTVSLPVSGKVVVVDAGHGVPDERSCLLTLKITLIFYKK